VSPAGLKRNFALVGDNSDLPEKVLVKDSQSHFLMHARGRRHCQGLYATLDLTKRHDLFSVIYNQLFVKPSKSADVLQIEIPLNEMGKFCWAIYSKAHKEVFADCTDITRYTEVSATKKLPKELQLRTDCDEITPEMLRGEGTTKAIEKFKDFIRIIHVSDRCQADPRNPAMLRFEFQLPNLSKETTKNDPKDGRVLAEEMMQLAIHLVDVTAKSCDWLAKHSQVTIKVEQRRVERYKSKSRHVAQMEEAAKRKDAKAAAEKEKLENMGDAERRKYEEKKYRQDMKKKMSSRTKVMR